MPPQLSSPLEIATKSVFLVHVECKLYCDSYITANSHKTQGVHYNTLTIVIAHHTYFSGAQAALLGFSSLVPFSSTFSILMASTAGYGILPALNTSQHVTPNDHCMEIHSKTLYCYREFLTQIDTLLPLDGLPS